MALKLHVLTAISRPENIPELAMELATAALEVPEFDVVWHWRFDLERQNVGGQALKNEMLDEIDDGWVWVLDDDTSVHPELFPKFAEAIEEFPNAQALIVGQSRSDGTYLPGTIWSVSVGLIDIGQALLRRDLIGKKRIPLLYDGDGYFLVDVLTDQHEVLWLDRELSYHNARSSVAA